SASEFMFEET
nr:long-chain acyl-CoA dehydrogenase, LCAD [human, Peptide Partial, 10 aa] [Homo sapiens]